MNIRKATTADIPALNNLVNGAYRGEDSKKGWTTEADLIEGIRTSEATLHQMLTKPNGMILLAEAEALQGCVYLEQQGELLYLGMLTVQPGLQGKGLGAQLMIAAEETSKELGCNRIKMTVISVRSSLIAFYERRGYVDTGERAPFPTDEAFGIAKKPLEFMVMEKQLT